MNYNQVLDLKLIHLDEVPRRDCRDNDYSVKSFRQKCFIGNLIIRSDAVINKRLSEITTIDWN